MNLERIRSLLDEEDEIYHKLREELGLTPETHAIDFRVKGGRLATSSDTHAWAWIRDRYTGEEYIEVAELVQMIKNSYENKVQLDGFEYSISPDTRFLWRRKL